MQDNEFDFFVIGAGSGGVRAARIAAAHGAKVGIAEGRDLGGTCVNRGCVPKKLMVYAAKFNKEFNDSAGYGWWFFGLRHFNWQTLLRNKDNEIKRLNDIYRTILTDAGVSLFNGYARFIDPHTVEIDGQQVKARKFLIATGGVPKLPDIKGAEHLVTSDDIFHLDKMPGHIVIMGGGYIALEFASIFKGLGSDVTIIHRNTTLLRGFDHDIRKTLEQEMQKKDIRLLLDCAPLHIRKEKGKTLIQTDHGEIIRCDLALAATGRAPNTASLGLDLAGVQPSANGAIPTNRDNQTNIPHIYALGDIANHHNLTPVAIEEGHALVDRLYGNQPDRYISYDNIPTAVFTDPPIGTVGITEDQAKADKIDYILYKTSFRPMKYTLSGRDEKTFMKLIVARDSHKVLGVHMLGEDAPEIIQMAAIAVKMGATKQDFDATIGVHPTAAEEFVTMRTPSQP